MVQWLGHYMWGRASLAATAVAESVSEVRPLEIVKNRATTELEVAESRGEGEAGCSWYRTTCTTSAAATTATKSVGEVRPLECAQYSVYAVACESRTAGIAKHSARTESELAEFSGGAVAPCAPDQCRRPAAVTSAGKARPPEEAKYTEMACTLSTADHYFGE